MKKALLWLAVAIAAAAPIHSQAKGPIRVAVTEFQTKGEATFKDAGRIIPEWLIASLNKQPSFSVVERVLLDKVLEEQGLALSGLVGAGGAKAGALAGADAIVAGSVIAWAGSLSVTARLIDATSGEVIRAATLQGADAKSLPSELDKLARVLSGAQPASTLALPPAARGVKAKEYPVSVVKATDKEGILRVVVDRGLEDGVQKKMAYAIMMPEFGESEVSGEKVRVGMKRVGLIVVDYVEPNFAAGDFMAAGKKPDPKGLMDLAVAVPTAPYSTGLELGSLNVGGEFGQFFGAKAGVFGYYYGYEAGNELARTVGGMEFALYYVRPVIGNFMSKTIIGPGLSLGGQFMTETPFGTAAAPVDDVAMIVGAGFLEADIGGFLLRAGAKASLAIGKYELGYGETYLVNDFYLGLVVEPLVTIGYRLSLFGK